MDRQYSGVSEYTLNLVREILKQDRINEYRLFYNSGRDVRERIEKNLFAGKLQELSSEASELSSKQGKVKIINTRYPNKIFNWPMQKILKWPKVDKLLGKENGIASSLPLDKLGVAPRNDKGVEIFYCPNIVPIAMSKNCKKVITIHDLSFLLYPEFFDAKRRWWHRAINAKKLLKRFDVVAAVSENTKNDIIELCGIDEKKVKVIYSGVGEEFQMTNDEMRMTNKIKAVVEKYSLPEKFILFLGTLEPRKNVAGLIEAYNLFRDENKALADIKLVIAGGRGWKSEDIFLSWKKSKYKDDIKFLGYVEPGEKACLYNLAEVFVFPSFYEGFGFPPLEAMASGVPVITCFSSSLGEVAGEAALLVDPYNIREIARAIKSAVTDEALRSRLRERGLKQAKKFNWQKTVRGYLDIFSGLN